MVHPTYIPPSAGHGVGGNLAGVAGHSRGVSIDYRLATDQELWSYAAGRQAGSAFGELFERHADAVYVHCFRRTGSWSVAEDLTSTVFLEAWRRRKHVRFAGDSALPWLLAVANNATRNAERALRRYRRLLAKLPPPAGDPDIADEAAIRVDQERAARRVLGMLGGLPERDREILALCDWSGVSYAAAAAVLRIPEGTVRSRLSRARQHIRKLANDSERLATSLDIAQVITTAPEDKR